MPAALSLRTGKSNKVDVEDRFHPLQYRPRVSRGQGQRNTRVSRHEANVVFRGTNTGLMRLQASNLRSDERSTRMALQFLSRGHEPGGDGNKNKSTSHSWFCARTSGSTGALPGTSWAMTLMYISVSTHPFRRGYSDGEMPSRESVMSLH